MTSPLAKMRFPAPTTSVVMSSTLSPAVTATSGLRFPLPRTTTDTSHGKRTTVFTPSSTHTAAAAPRPPRPNAPVAGINRRSMS